MITQYERIWITMHYACGCISTFPVFRIYENEYPTRTVSTYKLCEHHQALSDQEYERRANMPEKIVSDHYMIDGFKWHIYQKRGYWHARRYEKKKMIYKYFGKADPRPLLGEPLLEEVEE